MQLGAPAATSDSSKSEGFEASTGPLKETQQEGTSEEATVSLTVAADTASCNCWSTAIPFPTQVYLGFTDVVGIYIRVKGTEEREYI